MRAVTITQSSMIDLITEECYSCGCLFGMTKQFRTHRLSDKKSFYCPNGHVQIYTGKTDKEKLQEADRLLASAEENARIQAARAQRAEAEAKRLRTRANAGVCPCCNRSFVQLARHIKTKHPEQAAS